MTGTIARRIAVISGACGGMGKALARDFGADRDLVLTDLNDSALSAFANELADEGYVVAAKIAGSLEDDGMLADLAAAQREAGVLGVLLHTAGLSPTLADWRTILRVNVAGTHKVLNAFEPSLVTGAVGVLIASMAGHLAPASAEIDELLADPLAPTMLEGLAPLIAATCTGNGEREMENRAYSFSKREVIRICERRAAAWAGKGARIMSISPGTIWTPMLRTELATNPGTVAVLDSTPVRRWGKVTDIAAAARFLASDAASFVTGADLRVDGGVTPTMNGGPIH